MKDLAWHSNNIPATALALGKHASVCEHLSQSLKQLTGLPSESTSKAKLGFVRLFPLCLISYNVAAFVPPDSAGQRTAPLKILQHAYPLSQLREQQVAHLRSPKPRAKLLAMRDNKLSIDTGSYTTGIDPIDDGLATPAFRRDLQKAAPQLVSKFDNIRRNKNHQLEEYGRKHNRVKADLIKKQATAVSSDNGNERGDSDRSSGLGSSTDGSSVSPQPYEQPGATSPAKVKVPPPASTRSNTTNVTTATARVRKTLTSSEAVLTMQIQIRLIPAIKLLTAPVTTRETRAQAKAQAQVALDFANANKTSLPLQARCSFYIAHATYDPQDPTTTQDAVNWFQRATEASEADYPEGQWAQEWLNRYESLNMGSRPSSSSSWISTLSNNVWNAVFRKNSSAEDSTSAPELKPPPAPFWRLLSNENMSVPKETRKNYSRIPSFSTMYSGETARSNSAKVASPTSPNSGTSSVSQDHHNLKRSPKCPPGKAGKSFELVNSPEPIYEDDHESAEGEERISAKVPVDLVDASSPNPGSSSSDYYVTPGSGARKRRSTNAISASQSDPNSPSTTNSSSSASASTALTLPPPSPNTHHSRAQSISLAYPTAPFSPVTANSIASHSYALSEGARSSDNLISRNKKRLSI